MERNDRPKPDKDKTLVTPEPARPDLFAFVENLFGDDQKPECIDVRQAYGPGARKHGPIILKKEYKANQKKPTREEMVSLSNELLASAQNDCNVLSKPHRYAILPKHFAKSDNYYQCFLVSLTPKQPNPDAYDPMSDDEDVEGANGFDQRHKVDMLRYSLEHLKHGDEHERYRQDQFSTAMGDIIEKYQNIVMVVTTHNVELQKQQHEMFKALEAALSQKSEREIATKQAEFKMQVWQQGFRYLTQLAPVVVQQLNGKNGDANGTIAGPSAESLGCKAFCDGLNDEQARQIFGTLGDDGKLQPNGLFTPAQVEIFLGIAHGQLPAAAIDKLLEGEHALTELQKMKAMNIVSSEQFMPLVMLVMGRQRKIQQQKQVSEETTETIANP